MPRSGTRRRCGRVRGRGHGGGELGRGAEGGGLDPRTRVRGRGRVDLRLRARAAGMAAQRQPAGIGGRASTRAGRGPGVAVDRTARAGTTPVGRRGLGRRAIPATVQPRPLDQQALDNLLADTLRQAAGPWPQRPTHPVWRRRFSSRRASVWPPRQLVRLLVRMRKLRTSGVLRRSLPRQDRLALLGCSSRAGQRARLLPYRSGQPRRLLDHDEPRKRRARGAAPVGPAGAGHRRLRRVAFAHPLRPR
jgi:hypothetical protein